MGSTDKFLPLRFLYHLCINPLGLSEQSTTAWVVSTIGTYFLTVLEARGPRSSCQQDWFLGKPLPWFGDGSLLPVSSHGLPVSVRLLGQVSMLVHGLAPTLMTSF